MFGACACAAVALQVFTALSYNTSVVNHKRDIHERSGMCAGVLHLSGTP